MNTESMLLFPNQAQKLLGVKSTTFYELLKKSGFPKPKYPTGRRPMYSRKELEDWINAL
jgi:predicted DNA-binding transcriptional regulator AlpA